MATGNKATMDRPREIRRFAMLAVTACLINVCTTLIVMDFGAGSLAGSAIGAAISIGLILWITHGRKLIGRIMLTIWLGFGVVIAIAGYGRMIVTHSGSSMSPAVNGLSLISLALNCAALLFLWSRASTRWLAAKPPVAP